MSSGSITLLMSISELDMPIGTIVEQGTRVPVEVSIDALVDYLVGNLPQKAQAAFTRDCTRFLQYVAGSANSRLMQEYLADCVVELIREVLPDQLLTALGALTDAVVDTDTKDVGSWIERVVSTLNNPYITKPLVAGLLSSGMPKDPEEFDALVLTLL